MAVAINVWQSESGTWRADPPELHGSPPNGTGQTRREAVLHLMLQLALETSAVYRSILLGKKWPEVEITDIRE